ncbi:MAG: hypothetical protein QXP42_01065 [Candidatus Micrarchaeia archaeon]
MNTHLCATTNYAFFIFGWALVAVFLFFYTGFIRKMKPNVKTFAISLLTLFPTALSFELAYPGLMLSQYKAELPDQNPGAGLADFANFMMPLSVYLLLTGLLYFLTRRYFGSTAFIFVATFITAVSYIFSFAIFPPKWYLCYIL